MKSYMTEKRKQLISFLKENSGRLMSAEEIQMAIKTMSISAVYRNLFSLCENGFLRKSFAEDGHTALYQYCDRQHCSSHLHMKCNLCGRMQCVNSEASEKIVSALKESGAFNVDESGTVIYGTCDNCVCNKER